MNDPDLILIAQQTRQAVTGLIAAARPEAGQILVLGGSTSEVQGQCLGTASHQQLARVILAAVLEAVSQAGLNLAVQCCEHLNRALVVEAEAARRHQWEIVHVYPVPQAGGALAAMAMAMFVRPVVVETLQGHLGMDIGATLIGMHLRPVVVPVRLEIRQIGLAPLTLASTRPRLIGGERAVYQKPE